MQDIHTAGDWVKHTPTSSTLERFEAFFGAHAFDPHRHDTYAIGRIVAGVHRLNYRGESKLCLPGEVMIVHPDESHGGCAGSDTGFRYRGVYVPPSLVQQIVWGKPLPFLKGGVTRDSRLGVAANALLDAREADPLAEDDALYGFVTTLAQLAGQSTAGKTGHFAAASRAREYIDDNLDRPITLDDLAECAERDRWSLSNDFRLFYGTSPHRYLTLRRLDRVKQLVQAGRSLSEAAVEAGFFDQSHMSRHFKKNFGLSPSRWCSPDVASLHE
ncbi:AraC family transcriptional regulator [Pseudomonas sp. ADAK18]|uniref:helix-turn-helix domain-containing protein n=1 Tax=Pseudomonas sp. ADAK18 TaxID=2730848 RepID=UPI0014646C7F|nr:AraC family transcriptional regulator [Pseudomonas sp. ADAK18]QJI29432.1 AraC family transcriptional regulator [Pseudomonas sp. ADAK18]